MPDCKQSNIHLGATAIGSADRASDDEVWHKHLSSREYSPRTPYQAFRIYTAFRCIHLSSGEHTPRTLSTKAIRVEQWLPDLYFKSMPDCKQSNIHLGATAIGSADRASDEEESCKPSEALIAHPMKKNRANTFSSRDLSPRSFFLSSFKKFKSIFRVE